MRRRSRRDGTNRTGNAEARSVVWEVLRRRLGTGALGLERVRLVWPKIASPFGDAPLRSWPAALRGRVLLVDVSDNQWLHELAYYKASILARLREICPEPRIDQIKLGLARGPIGPRDPEPITPAAETAQPRPTLSADPPRETMDALHKVHDPALRDALATARMVLGQTSRRKT